MTVISTSSIQVFYPKIYTGISANPPDESDATPETTNESEPTEDNAKSSSTTQPFGKDDKLIQAEIQEIQRLKQRDQEVRSHERAHIMAGGPYVRGSATFQYQYGPDGQRYAVGGEVGIDMSQIPGDPEATAEKMRTVIRAALAPSEPSPQDRIVASRASRILMDMQVEMMMLKMAQWKGEYQKTTEMSPGRAIPGDQGRNNPASGTGSLLNLFG